MRFRTARYVALGLLLVCGIALAAEEGVKVVSFSGDGVVQSGGGAGVPLANGATLSQGDTVSIGSGSTGTFEFADGSVMEVTGPARFGLELVADYARTVRLYEGTINWLVVKEVTTGIVTPGGAFVAAQFGTVFTQAQPGADGQMRTTFKLLEGVAKTGMKGGDVSVMSVDTPIVYDVEVPGAIPTPRAPAGEAAGESFALGIHDVRLFPPGGVAVEVTANGGRKITSTLPEGDYAMVVIDEDTTVYLGSGESVTLGPDGFVRNNDGVVHVYNPLTVSSFFFDPVKDPAGSSFTGNAVR